MYFAAVLILLMYLLWMMIRPFLGAIIFASIITGSIYPVYFKMLQSMNLSRGITAALMCTVVVVVVFLPTLFLSFILSKEAIVLYQNVASGISNETVDDFFFGDGYISDTVKKLSAWAGIEANMEMLKNEILKQIKNFSGVAIETINNVLGNIVSFLFNFIVMILVIYTLLAKGPQLKVFFLRLSPLPDEQEELIIEKFNQMNFVTLVCNGLGGLIQGILAGIGFWLAGINLVVLWTTIMIILAFIPLLGISIIYIPACIYLALIGNSLAAIMLFIYCSLVALITENWFKPIFIGNRIQINSLFVLFSIIGGMTVFGVGGIFYGPIIAILFLTTVELYHKFYSN